MRAMLLCAGFGERLKPLTAELPKPCFPVANRPLLWYTLRLLLSWGVDRVMVNAHHLPEMLMRTVRSCCPDGMAIDFSFEEEILGTGGGLRKVRGWFDDDPFIVMNGDILTDMDVAGAVDFHLSSSAVATMVLSGNARYKSLGEVEVDDGGRVRSILDRPKRTGRDLIPTFFTGIHVMSAGVFDFLPDQPRSCLIRDCYSGMVERDEGVLGFIIDSYWRDIGIPRAYLEANIEVLDGKYEPPFELEMESEKISAAVLEPPFLIGRGARVGRDVRIGPYAIIGDEAVIEEGCIIRESVVWPGVTVPGRSDLVRTVAGRSASIRLA